MPPAQMTPFIRLDAAVACATATASFFAAAYFIIVSMSAVSSGRISIPSSLRRVDDKMQFERFALTSPRVSNSLSLIHSQEWL